MKKYGWRVRLRSWFDSTMDRGTPALVGWLGLAALVLVGIITGLVLVFARHDGNNGDVAGIAWMSLMRTIDSGTMGGDGGSIVFRLLMLAVTIGGIFLVGSLIGVLTNGMDNRLTELRKGRSPVLARGHTVLLGWSDQVFTIVSELVRANQANARRQVVVLAEQDSVEMGDLIRQQVGNTGRLRVICRTGNPMKVADLEMVNLDAAASVIVMSPTGDDADIKVIKTLLLLQHRAWPQSRPDDRPQIVAAVQDSHNMAAARLAAGPYPQLVDADDITVRLVVQSHRQAGLSTVYSELLQFAGNEIYLRSEPTLTGRTYGQALHGYAEGTPIGLRRRSGAIELNPPSEARLEAGDEVVVIAADDTEITLTDEAPKIDEQSIVTVDDDTRRPDRTLLIGWNSRGTKVLSFLDTVVAPGSAIDIAAPEQPLDVIERAWTNLSIGYKPCEPTNRRALQALELSTYKHVVVLSDDRVPEPEADDRTLVTLLHLRDLQGDGDDAYAIVTEMHDDANREVAQVTKADDFIVSTRLISLLLTQLSENRHLQPVLNDLFDPAGVEIVLKRATEYVADGATVTFSTVVESARRRGETAIGYRLHRGRDVAPGYGVVLNPRRSDPITLCAADSVVVVAEF